MFYAPSIDPVAERKRQLAERIEAVGEVLEEFHLANRSLRPRRLAALADQLYAVANELRTGRASIPTPSEYLDSTR